MFEIKNPSIDLGIEIIDTRPKTVEEILTLLNQELDLHACDYRDVDVMLKDSFRLMNECNEKLGIIDRYDVTKMCFFFVPENEKSRVYYQNFRINNSYEPARVYLYLDKGKLSSNCILLRTKIALLEGIDDQETSKAKRDIYEFDLESYYNDFIEAAGLLKSGKDPRHSYINLETGVLIKNE